MSRPDHLQALRELHETLEFRVQKARREAEILLAQANALECAQIDLDMAIDKAVAALAEQSA